MGLAFQVSFRSPTTPLRAIIFAMSIALDHGAMPIGGLLGFGLSGCVNMQFIVYCRVYFYESWRTKSLVIVIWLLDLCHSALVASALWDSIIASDSGLDTLDIIPWSIGPAIELTAMITFIVQLEVVQSKKLTVVIPIVVLSLVRLGRYTLS
ncbi:uncharacterized protein HD556DRAFT_401637 [Suillus plorans]|uniref:Uncharacterized protein n=1 Tax=Suillus plorans TaxID=116603 RepID=A0A9P7AR51_9AGAM|nr:uncharacterized protein HD556DRAFT_401637 [Suillus plorans]KAG1794775.1 hypothetical protein HD556DRAFT_401637 [Suillus plorans]